MEFYQNDEASIGKILRLLITPWLVHPSRGSRWLQNKASDLPCRTID